MDGLYLILGVVGCLAGFIDAIAGGGGLITLPALLWAGLPPQIALGTNKLQSCCGTTLAAWKYHQAGLVHAGEWKWGIALTALSSMAGSVAATFIKPEFLRIAIPFLLLIMGVYLTFKPELGKKERPARMHKTTFTLIFGSALGFYDGIFGPGTGSFWMTASIIIMGMDFRLATGLTKAMNLASNAGALLVFGYSGKVQWGVGVAMAAGQLLGAYLGSKWVIQSGARWVRPIFLVLVFILAGRLLWQNFHS